LKRTSALIVTAAILLSTIATAQIKTQKQISVLEKRDGVAIATIGEQVPIDTLKTIGEFTKIRICGYADMVLSSATRANDIPLFSSQTGTVIIGRVCPSYASVLDSSGPRYRIQITGWTSTSELFDKQDRQKQSAASPVPVSDSQNMLRNGEKAFNRPNRDYVPYAFAGLSLIATGIMAVMTSSDYGDAAKELPAGEARDKAKSRELKYGLVGYPCLIGGTILMIVSLTSTESQAPKANPSVFIGPVISSDYSGACLSLRF
jgi:hypothetical protein